MKRAKSRRFGPPKKHDLQKDKRNFGLRRLVLEDCVRHHPVAPNWRNLSAAGPSGTRWRWRLRLREGRRSSASAQSIAGAASESIPRRRHVLRPRAPPCDKALPSTEQGLIGSMSRRGKPYNDANADSFMKTMKVAPRRPLNSLPALTALSGRTKIVRSAALHLDLLHQLLSLGGLRHLHGEHAMLEARLHRRIVSKSRAIAADGPGQANPSAAR